MLRIEIGPNLLAAIFTITVWGGIVLLTRINRRR